jgi:hypothetical protein
LTGLADLKLSSIQEEQEDLELREQLENLSIRDAGVASIQSADGGGPSTPVKPAASSVAGDGAREERKAIVLKSPPKKGKVVKLSCSSGLLVTGPKTCGVPTTRVPHHPCKKPVPCALHGGGTSAPASSAGSAKS